VKLYRDKTYEEDERDWFQGCSHIEVQPCVHGKYDEHLKPTSEWGVHKTEADWCPGGLADNKEKT